MKRRIPESVYLLGLICLSGCLAVPILAQHRARVRARSGGEGPQRVVISSTSPQLAQITLGTVGTREVSPSEVVAPGKIGVIPSRLCRVLLPLPGRISELRISLGDTMEAGETLVLVDSPDADQAVAENLQAEADLVQAEVSKSKAETDLARLKDLFEHQAVARKEVIEAENAVVQANALVGHGKAAERQTRRRLEILTLFPREFGQKIDVRAPISGRVIELNITSGEYRTDCSQPVATIADLSKVWVLSEVPETMIRWIEVGERVEVELVAYPGEVFNARVVRIADFLNSQTRTIQVQAEIGNQDGRLRPEMFARIRHVHPARNLPVVPSSAVIRREGSSYVFREVEAGIFEKTTVRTEELGDSMVALLQGLSPGERVVVKGALLLDSKCGQP